MRASVGGGARSLSTMRHRRFQPVVFLVFSRGCQLPARGGTPQKESQSLAFFCQTLAEKSMSGWEKILNSPNDRPAWTILSLVAKVCRFVTQLFAAKSYGRSFLF